MTMDKTQASRTVSVLTTSGLSGKTISDVIVTLHGSVTVIEVQHTSGAGTQFVKVKQGVVEVGGTNEFGTGTVVAQR